MHRFIISIILLILINVSGQSQDTLITTDNDTILCKVIANNKHIIRFKLFQGGIETKGKLKRAKLRQLIILTEDSESKNNLSILNHWIVGFSGGPGFLLANAETGKSAAMSLGLSQAQADNYYQQLKTGWQAGINVHYFLHPDFAIGINYRIFTSDADLWATMDPQDGVHMFYGKIIENMYVNYTGISVLTQKPLDNHHKLFINSAMSAGITWYRDESNMLSTSYLLTGKGFGLTVNFGLEYFIFRNISAGANINLFSSKIRKMTLNDGSSSTSVQLGKENSENISSLDLSAAVKIYF